MIFDLRIVAGLLAATACSPLNPTRPRLEQTHQGRSENSENRETSSDARSTRKVTAAHAPVLNEAEREEQLEAEEIVEIMGVKKVVCGIHREMSKNWSRFDVCFLARCLSPECLHGNVVISFYVADSGRATNVEILRKTNVRDPIIACVLDEIAKLRFPAPYLGPDFVTEEMIALGGPPRNDPDCTEAILNSEDKRALPEEEEEEEGARPFSPRD